MRAVVAILNNLVLYHMQIAACLCSLGRNLDQQLLPEQTAPFLRRWLLPLCGGTSKLRILVTHHGHGRASALSGV